MLILVVDDDPAVRESLLAALRLEGYEIAEAADGVEALARSRRGSASTRSACGRRLYREPLTQTG